MADATAMIGGPRLVLGSDARVWRLSAVGRCRRSFPGSLRSLKFSERLTYIGTYEYHIVLHATVCGETVVTRIRLLGVLPQLMNYGTKLVWKGRPLAVRLPGIGSSILAGIVLVNCSFRTS